MKRIAIYIILSITLISAAHATDIQKDFSEANSYYTQNHFDQAINKYQEILKQGFTSPELYFNLGNAYFKTKNISKAILYFEKAKLLAPSDKDINFNLELARSFTIDKIESIPDVFFVGWFKSLRDSLSLNAWTSLSILFFILTLIIYLIFLLTRNLALKKWSFWLGTLLLLLTISSFGSAYSHYSAITNQESAIIFTPTVNIKSSPSETGNNLFILHEGTKVEILGKVGDWCEIKIVSGSRGFIKLSDLEVI